MSISMNKTMRRILRANYIEIELTQHEKMMEKEGQLGMISYALVNYIYKLMMKHKNQKKFDDEFEQM